MRKYLKYIVAVVLVLISVFMAKAQNSGYGCRIGNIIYTQYIGDEHPHHPSNPLTKYYNSNGNKIDIHYNNYDSSKPNNYGYDCTKINVFDASSTGPAQQEYTKQNTSCVTSAYLGGPIIGDGGDYVYFSYKNPNYCSNIPPVGLPIDDYAWAFVLAVGAIGGIIISKKGVLV